MENEWESNYVPAFVVPWPEDKMWMRGQWIFDCAHQVIPPAEGPDFPACLVEEPPKAVARATAPKSTDLTR